MNEKEAMAFIEEAAGYGIVPGLDNIRELCKRLGNPQKALKFVHVAGTNGKGSVCAYIASILKAGGYKVGRYISPDIFSYREIIQVNDRNITVRALCQGMERIRLQKLSCANINNFSCRTKSKRIHMYHLCWR